MSKLRLNSQNIFQNLIKSLITIQLSEFARQSDKISQLPVIQVGHDLNSLQLRGWRATRNVPITRLRIPSNRKPTKPEFRRRSQTNTKTCFSKIVAKSCYQQQRLTFPDASLRLFDNCMLFADASKFSLLDSPTKNIFASGLDLWTTWNETRKRRWRTSKSKKVFSVANRLNFDFFQFSSRIPNL